MTDPRSLPVVVVPCYNEAARLSPEGFATLVSSGRVALLFVDDGSTDDTAAVLERMADEIGTTATVEVFRLEENTGKAEAVRRGMLRAVRNGAELVGYYDADLATPPSELLRLVDLAERRPELVGVLGCRVSRLGGTIDRSVLRHYLGRVYATLASAVLRVPVYDTQCGAKIFRVDGAVTAALVEPFRSTWAFDVELLQRLFQGSPGTAPLTVDDFVEVPLDAWRDVAGSKLSFKASLRALVELFLLARPRRRRTEPAAAPIKKVRRARGGPAERPPAAGEHA